MTGTVFIDTENTTKNKGHCYTRSNKCCTIQIAVDDDSPIVFKIEYDNEPYGDNLRKIQEFISLCDTVVGFNFKYDLHWLKRYGIDVSNLRVWDCQIAQFVIECQTNKYPSLDGAAEYWGLGKKLDIIKTQYWDKGLDTTEVPWDILYEYAAKDVELTREVYKAQKEYLADKPKMHKLITLDCLDLLVLQEMEQNGLKYDVEESLAKANELKGRINVLYSELDSIAGVVGINWNSGDQVSAVLYGGEIKFTRKELVPFTYKDGRTTQKLKNVEQVVTFPRLVEPLRKTELKKFGLFQTGAPILKDLKAKGTAKLIIARLIELSDLEKQVSTYLEGIPKLIEEMEWSDNVIHGNLNQCVAVTGRLSSTKPNLQNMTADVDKLFRSRYD